MNERPIRWEYDLLDRDFVPRDEPLPPPAAGIFDEPKVTVELNRGWLSHVLGVLEALNVDDAWTGTESEVYSARQEIEKLMALFESGVTIVPGVQNLRQIGKQLQYTLDGSTWVDFATTAIETVADASFNAVTDIATFTHDSVLTPSAGFGAGLRLRALDALGQLSSVGRWRASWDDPTNRYSRVVLSIFEGTTERDVLIIARTGTSSYSVGINRVPRAGVALDVQGAAAFSSFISSVFQADFNNKLAFGGSQATLSSSTGMAFLIDADNTQSGEIFTFGRGSTALASSVELARLTSAGFLGLGTNNPSSRLDITGDVEIGSGNYFYLGDPTTDGSWRMGRFGETLSFQKRVAGVWADQGIGGGDTRIELRDVTTGNGYHNLQWKYIDEDESGWRALALLQDGLTPEMRGVDYLDGRLIQFKYDNEGADEWRNLVSVQPAQLRNQAGLLQWRNLTDGQPVDWTDLYDLTDDRVEMRGQDYLDGKLLQWKYNGETSDEWRNLVSVQPPELRTLDGVLQWRYTGDQALDWADLYDLGTGTAGDPAHRCAVARGLARGFLADLADWIQFFFDPTNEGTIGVLDTLADQMIPQTFWIEYDVLPDPTLRVNLVAPMQVQVWNVLPAELDRYQKLFDFITYAGQESTFEVVAERIYCVLTGFDGTLTENDVRRAAYAFFAVTLPGDLMFWKLLGDFLSKVMTLKRAEMHAVAGAALEDGSLCAAYNCAAITVPYTLVGFVGGGRLASRGETVTVELELTFSAPSTMTLLNDIIVDVGPDLTTTTTPPQYYSSPFYTPVSFARQSFVLIDNPLPGNGTRRAFTVQIDPLAPLGTVIDLKISDITGGAIPDNGKFTITIS